MAIEPTEYDTYVQNALTRLAKQQQTQTDSAEGWATLALAFELHRFNDLKEMELRIKQDELAVIRARL